MVFSLDIHVVEHLFLHLARGEAAGILNQAVGKGGFAVVDMGDDGKIADLGKVCAHAGADSMMRRKREGAGRMCLNEVEAPLTTYFKFRDCGNPLIVPLCLQVAY